MIASSQVDGFERHPTATLIAVVLCCAAVVLFVGAVVVWKRSSAVRRMLGVGILLGIPAAITLAHLGTTTYGVPDPFVERQVCDDIDTGLSCEPTNAEIAPECDRLTNKDLIVWQRTSSADPFTTDIVRCADLS